MANAPLVYRLGLHAEEGRIEFASFAKLHELLKWQGSIMSLRRAIQDLYAPKEGESQIVFVSPSLKKRAGDKIPWDGDGYLIEVTEKRHHNRINYFAS